MERKDILKSVKEITEIVDVKEANRLLESGWVVLAIYKPTEDSDVVFSLGRLGN